MTLAAMIELTEQPIDVTRLLNAVTDVHCGAEVLFVGTTRQWTQGRPADGETELLAQDRGIETSKGSHVQC